MDWKDEGIILSVRPQSESNAVVELLTRGHGRHLGLVRGGRSRRHRPTLQISNVIEVNWRARLSEHLGTYTVDLKAAHAALLMDDRATLAGISSLCSLARLLAERDPHPGLYEAFLLILDHIGDRHVWPGLMVRWEFELLNELGFGLDLTDCAATGMTEDLVYVSPKTGRAVSQSAGAPYKDKLLKLPAFLRSGSRQPVSSDDIIQGFALTGYFLETRVLVPRGLEMSEARGRLIAYLDGKGSNGASI